MSDLIGSSDCWFSRAKAHIVVKEHLVSKVSLYHFDAIHSESRFSREISL